MSLEKYDVSKLYESNKNLKREDVELLQKWLDEQRHLPKVTEVQIIWFLHSCYFNIENTKITIDNYFTCRTDNPHLFECPRGEEFEEAFSFMSMMVLPKTTPAGDPVAMSRLFDSKPEQFHFNSFFKIFCIALTLYLKQNGSKEGYFYVLDAKHSTVGHLIKMPVGTLKKMAFFLQEAAPIRLKAIHIANCNTVAYSLMTILKPFLKKELAEMIFFHSTLESLHKYIPKECLVEEYGGTLPSFLKLNEDHLRNVRANLEFLRWQDTQKVDESKRPKKENQSYFEWFKRMGGF